MLGLTMLVGGCGQGPPPPSVPPSTPSAERLADARRFRESFGLQTDDAWIVTVALDPSSQAGIEQFGVPLLPAELEALIARTQASTDVAQVILDYGRTVPEDWYGSYIDQQRGGIVVAQFFRDGDHHREVLARLLPPSARWEVHVVDQRTMDMIAFVAQVKADGAWFETVDAELLDVVVSPLDGGHVELTYIAAARDLDPVIRLHFGDPAWLRVERAGGLPWTGPVGDLIIKAVDAGGRPVSGLTCGLGNPPLTTDRDGTCRYQDLAAVRYHVELRAGIEEPRGVVGAADVIVAPNRSTTLTILVQRP
jgi:hypothetical protein